MKAFIDAFNEKIDDNNLRVNNVNNNDKLKIHTDMRHHTSTLATQR